MGMCVLYMCLCVRMSAIKFEYFQHIMYRYLVYNQPIHQSEHVTVSEKIRNVGTKLASTENTSQIGA